MTDEPFELTRRKVLAGLGSVGVVSTGAGLGTTAYFSDAETFADNQLVAGELDLKVGWDVHYSDWSGDEASGLDYEPRMSLGDLPGDTTLADWTALPTPAQPMLWVHEGDVEQFLANTRQERFPNGGLGDANPCSALGDVPDDLSGPIVDLADVKPGDFGEVTFDVALCDNPGYLWMTGDLVDAAENGLTEPEGKDPDESADVVELLDAVQVAVWYDDDCDDVADFVGDEPVELPVPQTQTSLRTFLQRAADGKGIPLDATPNSAGDRACFPARGENGEQVRHCISLAWWLPVDHANEIQTDSVEFDLGFYTEQCRHNTDVEPVVQACDVVAGQGWGKLQEFQNGELTSFGRGRYGDGLDTGAWEVALAEGGFTSTIDDADYVWRPTVPVPFSYRYDGSNATFTLDGTSVSGPVPTPRGKVGVQIKALQAGISVWDLALRNANEQVAVAGQGIGVYNPTENRSLNYLIYGDGCVDAAAGFTLEGTVTLNLLPDFQGGDEDVAFDVIVE